MKVNHRGIRYFFRGFLVVMLVASIGIALFVRRHADELFQPPYGSITPQEASQEANRRSMGMPDTGGSEDVTPGRSSSRWGGPGWRGAASVVQREDGASEVTITPVNTRESGADVVLTSFQVYLRSIDGKNEQEITDRFSKDKAGNLKASLKGTAAGPWLLRVRLHRELSTLEFTQRIDVK